MSDERISDERLAQFTEWIGQRKSWKAYAQLEIADLELMIRELQHRRAEPPPSPASSEVGEMVERLKVVIRLEKINRHTGGYAWPPSDPTLLADLEIELTRLSSHRAEVVEVLLVEWRDAREVIFAADQPDPAAFTRLGAAELALMQHARSLTTPNTGTGK